RTKRRARGDAKRVRRRQRITEHRLKECARERQRSTGKETQERPRQSQLHKDRPIRFLAGAYAPEVESERTGKRQQQRSTAERRGKDPDPASTVPGLVRHSYATHGLPDAIVESVN